jgi:hypothetical protein
MAKNRFEDLFAEADAAFDGAYRDELNQLLGLSKEEIDQLTPDTTDLKTYHALIKVVEQASRDNLNQAQLVENIKKLGELGVKIAMKIPKLAELL